MATPPVTVRWNDAAHDHLWRDAADWSGAPPMAGLVAAFGDGAGTVDLAVPSGGHLSVGRIEVRGAVVFADGRLHSKDAPYDARFFSNVGLRVDDGGRLTVAATAAMMGMQTVLLGDVSAATVDIQGTLGDAQVYAGRAGAVSVTVEGAAARWNTSGIDQSFQWGGGAAASLVIRAGGHVVDAPDWASANANANSTMTIGGSTAGASVLVTDPGSLLRFQILDVGGSYSGTLDIAAGAHVLDRGGNVGESGDAVVGVSGAGTDWTSLDGLFVHGTIPHGTVSVTDHATVRFGQYGLQLDGDFLIDGTARLVGGVIVMGGGVLSAVASSGTAQSSVTISQSIELSYNVAVSGSNVGNFLGSATGATLVLNGAIAPQGSAYDPLAVGGGHVVLSNPGNGDFAMSLYGGVLEFSAAGASGSGRISFLDSNGATLQFDQTGTIANPIANFAVSGPDVIDLQAVSCVAPPTLAWQGSSHAGLLVVSDGTHSVGLSLGGGYKLSGFTVASDGHGGAALTYHP